MRVYCAAMSLERNAQPACPEGFETESQKGLKVVHHEGGSSRWFHQSFRIRTLMRHGRRSGRMDFHVGVVVVLEADLLWVI